MNQRIKNLMSKYSLEYVKSVREPDNRMVRSHLIVVKNTAGAKFTLKMFDSSDVDAIERFRKEIGYIRELRSNLKTRYRTWVPNIHWYSTKGDNPYYIFKYIEGCPLGKFVEDMGIKWGNFTNSNFKEFIGFFDYLSGLDEKIFRVSPQRWSYRTVQKELRYYFENAKNLLPQDLYDSVRTFVDNNHRRVFRDMSLSHRDLYPENILIKEPGSKKFAFLDWEYFSEVPVGFDGAFFYLLFWREGYWKGKIFSHYYHAYHDKEDKSRLYRYIKSFRFCLVILALRFIYQIDTFSDKSDCDFQNARLSFMSDLESALSGDIIRPNNIKFVLTYNDIAEVSKQYDIGVIRKYEIFYASKGNTVAKIDTNCGSYIFRFYSRSRSESLILRELRIFQLLSKRGIKTYNVISAKSKGLFIKHKLYGKFRKIAVLSYLRGSKIKKHWANEKAAEDAGKMLRKIHNANVIHGDYSKENVLYIKGKVTGVIDFEWGRVTSSKSAKFNDMAKAIALWLVDIRSRNIDELKFVASFVRGYCHIEPDAVLLKRIAIATISKVNEQRDIYLTTVDKTFDQNLSTHRFDTVVNKIKMIIPSDTAGHTV